MRRRLRIVIWPLDRNNNVCYQTHSWASLVAKGLCIWRGWWLHTKAAAFWLLGRYVICGRPTAPNFCICHVFCHSECLSPCVSRLEIATARLSGSVQYSNVRTRRRQFPLCAAINLYSSDRKNRKDFAPEAFIFCTTVSSGLLRCSILADRQNSKQ